MKAPGGSKPRVGWFHRSKASTAMIFLGRQLVNRLIMEDEFVPVDRKLDLVAQGALRVHVLLHVRHENTVCLAAGALGLVKRDVGLLDNISGN